MNERGGLKRVAGGFVRHLVRGQAAEFLINQRQQFVGGPGIALLDGGENARDFAHQSSPIQGVITIFIGASH